MVLKTAADRVEALTRRTRELHPYQVPEILALPVSGGNPGYLEWVIEETRAAPSGQGDGQT